MNPSSKRKRKHKSSRPSPSRAKSLKLRQPQPATKPDSTPLHLQATRRPLHSETPAASPAGSGGKTHAPYGVPTKVADPRLPPGLIFLTTFVVVMVVLLLNHMKEAPWINSENLIEKAKAALRQQNWPAALGAIQHVKEGSRQQPAFQRVLADYLEETRSSPQTLVEVLGKLKQSGEFRPEDHLWLCRAWLAQKKPDKARAAWDEIPAPLAQGLEATRLKIELLQQEGQLSESYQLQADLNAEFADVPLVAVRLAVAEINSHFPEVRLKANSHLWELARRRDKAGLLALHMLAHQTGRTVTEAETLLALVLKHPDARPADRQEIVSLLMLLAPTRRDELLQAETDRCERHDPAALAGWLAKEGETQRLEHLSLELRRLQPVEWFQMLARALAEARQWQELLKLVQQQQQQSFVGSISLAELLRWRAVALMQLHPHDTAAPYADLQMSIRQGGVEKNFASVALSARIAEDWSMFDLALEAGLIMAQPGAPDEIQMLENCRRVATLLKDSAALAGIATRLTQLQPENMQYARQDTYLRLLRGVMMETAIGRTAHMEKGDSASWLLGALQAWRQRELRSVHEALHHVQDSSRLSPGERAIYAGLLAKAEGDIAGAYRVAETVRPELLLPEEMTFLNLAR